MQLASLLSIKTGACPEDCAYCPQSAHYAKTDRPQARTLLDVDDVLDKARRRQGGRRHALLHGRGLARGEGRRSISTACSTWCAACAALGMEACVTLGMLTQSQADRLAEAGLTAYNHNLDTSPEFYGEIVTTRTYQDRLDTLARVRAAGITGLLRRHHRHGRERRGSGAAAADARQSRSASGKRADQCAGRGAAARRWPIGRRSIRSISCAWWRRRAS